MTGEKGSTDLKTICRNQVWKQAPLLLGVVFTGTLATRPFLEPRLPLTFDSLFHYDALVQLSYLFRQGILYPRWFPFKIGGFGAPFFQYYAPLASYVALALSLFGLDTLAALRAAWGLMVFGGAAGVVLWAREHLDVGAALVAAAALICGPYALSNAFFRGGFAEQCALMLMPFTLWSSSRLAATGRARYLAAGAATYAGIILAHSPTTFLFSPILLLYVLILTACRDRSRRRREVLLPQLGAIGLGLGLSAFFWLPFLVERNAFHSDLAYGSSALDYRHHFISLRDLVPLPFAMTLRPALSPIAVALALMGLLRTAPDVRSVVRGLCPSRRSALVWFAAFVAGACAIMTLPASAPVWEAVPLLRFLQFPHRFLTVGVVFLAFVAGAGAHSLWHSAAQALWAERTSRDPPSLTRRAARAAALLLPVLAAGLLAGDAWRLAQRVRYHPSLPEIDVNYIMEKERGQALRARELPTMFLPATVREMPPRELLMQEGSGRLDTSSLPVGAAVLEANYAPLRYALTLTSPEPFSARFRTFDFAGWQATLDGQRVPIAPTDPHGLISVEVPAGEHRLEIWFGSTPLRTGAAVLSVVSAAIVGLVTIAMRRRASVSSLT